MRKAFRNGATCLAFTAVACSSLTLFAQDRKVSLADLPSKPGEHIERIKALGDNEWLKLGSPAADPKWGKARGSSWGAKALILAPDIGTRNEVAGQRLLCDQRRVSKQKPRKQESMNSTELYRLSIDSAIPRIQRPAFWHK